MTTRVRRATVAAIGAMLLVGTVSGGAAAAGGRKPPEATTTVKCEAATSNREDLDRYDGKSASYMYDRKFRPGPDLRYSELSQFTPQGLTYWKDWNGNADLLLATAYDTGTRDSIIVGLAPARDDKGATVGVVRIESDHAGGIALYGDWLFVSDGPHAIRTFEKSALRKAMRESQDSGTEKTPKINPTRVTEDLYGTSFLATDSGGRKLYAGLFNKKRRDWMYRYTIDGGDGSLSLDRKEDGNGLKWEIPSSTQGVTLAGKRFLFSSSHGRTKRSNVWITNRAETNLDKASVRCFRAPSMAEGFATDGDTAYLLFESGSDEYNGNNGARARNVIDGAHKANLGDLTGTPGGRIHLGTLHSKNQQDSGGNDEITIKVEGQKLGKNVQIDQGDQKKMDKTVQFTGRVTVKLYERDPESGDDYLGGKTLEPGSGDGILTFKKRGGHYRLSYEIG